MGCGTSKKLVMPKNQISEENQVDTPRNVPNRQPHQQTSEVTSGQPQPIRKFSLFVVGEEVSALEESAMPSMATSSLQNHFQKTRTIENQPCP